MKYGDYGRHVQILQGFIILGPHLVDPLEQRRLADIVDKAHGEIHHICSW
ncbi:MAG TPA: hypothetical protein VMU10_03915 [Desulfomonilia bacterium]|nr:hypothetical protein [Desulfomonilia bacterium]